MNTAGDTEEEDEVPVTGMHCDTADVTSWGSMHG